MLDGFEAQKIIAQHLGPAAVITTMTTSRQWPQVASADQPDMPLGVSMGKTASVGLGLALARPDLKVVVLDGDGSLLMNLGTLVTVANMAPPNLIHFVFDNGVYRTTGGQPTPGAGKFSFAGLAKEAGYPNTHVFDDIKDFRREVGQVLSQPGPTFVCLKLPAETERAAGPVRRAAEAMGQFKAALERMLAQV